MKRITLYRHKDCERCRKVSRVHTFFDWFGRVECSTEEAPSGPLKMGEIEVRDHRSGARFKGVEAVRKVARQIPAYWVILPLLYLPPVARRVDAELRGCADGSCALPEVRSEVPCS